MLANYIRDLLYRNNNVIIPGFGSIVAQTVSAKIDKERNVIIPPTKILTFDAQQSDDDGVLAHRIAEVDNIPLESAQNFINFEVDNWKDTLQKQDLKIDEIGTFSLNTEREIIFEPIKDVNYFVDSFGFKPTKFSEISYEEKESSPIIETVETVVEQPKPRPKKKRKPKQSRWVTFFQYLALFGLFSALGWFFSQQIMQNKELFQKAKEMQESQDEVIKKHISEAIFEIQEPLSSLNLRVFRNPEFDSLMPKNEPVDSTLMDAKKRNQLLFPKKSETESSELTIPIPFDPKVETKSTNPTPNPENVYTGSSSDRAGRFYIIAGAFKDPENAIIKVKELKNKGYSALIISRTYDLTQVSYGLYTSSKEAERAMVKIKLEDPEAWIFEK